MPKKYLSGQNWGNELFIVGMIIDRPSHYLCYATLLWKSVCKTIQKHGLTRKKLQHVAKQRSLQYRGEYMAEIQMYHHDCFVFIDETGCTSKDNTHKLGYAMRGESAVEHRWVHSGNRISAIAAMTTFLTMCMAPEMLSFHGRNQKSIAVMDNCSINHVHPVTGDGILAPVFPLTARIKPSAMLSINMMHCGKQWMIQKLSSFSSKIDFFYL